MPDHNVDDVDEVRQEVDEDPVGDAVGRVVGEGQARRHEPDVVVEHHRHQGQPGDVATVWVGVGGGGVQSEMYVIYVNLYRYF